MNDPRRLLPAVDTVLGRPALHEPLAELPRAVVVAAVRGAIDEARAAFGAGGDAPPDDWADQLAERAAQLAHFGARPTLVPVINATGVILHTNLGRAPLAKIALERIARAAEGYANLEFDLEEGVRGSRYVHCSSLLCELTGAEDALVVNNAAAALILALNTAARGRRVVVSRGELIEIGGGFRIPEIVERAETQLTEIGTTNRTRAADYQRAIDDQTGALLKVHRSNFRIEGFSEDVDVTELRGLASEVQLPLVYDLGSGLMLPLNDPGLPDEPTVQQAVGQGADLVVFSGDKLLGGPQAGVIVGSKEWVQRARKNPLTRALRVDRLTLAALEATLQLYRDPDRARREIPTLRMIHAPVPELRQRSEALLGAVGGRSGVQIESVAMHSVVGGGTLPGAEIDSWGLRLRPSDDASRDATSVARALRTPDAEETPVVVRVKDDAVSMDLRTVEPRQDGLLAAALAARLR